MADSSLSDKDAITLLMNQVVSRNAEIDLRRRAMTKAVNMLHANDCTNDEVINALIAGM